MSFEDRYVTATPEGVSLDVTLAGLGSRFVAFLLDVVIQFAAFILVLIVLLAAFHGDSTSTGLVIDGVLALFGLLDFFGYFIACELLFSGRTVGKRAAGLRVVRVGGQPVGFWSSLLRNVLRLVDMQAVYLVGCIFILATKRNQRLGDLAANTIVIRERVAGLSQLRDTPWGNAAAYGAPAAQMPGAAGAGAWAAGFKGGPGTPGGSGWGWLPAELQHWDVSAVPDAELVMARTFLANRAGYDLFARQRLAADLANRIWPFVAGPTVPPHPEEFLEAVLRVKAARG